REQRSGKEASVTVQAAHGLSPDEVDQLVLESVEHAHDDFRARQLIEFKTKGAADVGYTERMLAEVGDRIPGDERQAIETAGGCAPRGPPGGQATSTPSAQRSPRWAGSPPTSPRRG